MLLADCTRFSSLVHDGTLSVLSRCDRHPLKIQEYSVFFWVQRPLPGVVDRREDQFTAPFLRKILTFGCSAAQQAISNYLCARHVPPPTIELIQETFGCETLYISIDSFITPVDRTLVTLPRQGKDGVLQGPTDLLHLHACALYPRPVPSRPVPSRPAPRLPAMRT